MSVLLPALGCSDDDPKAGRRAGWCYGDSWSASSPMLIAEVRGTVPPVACAYSWEMPCRLRSEPAGAAAFLAAWQAYRALSPGRGGSASTQAESHLVKAVDFSPEEPCGVTEGDSYKISFITGH